MVIRFLKSFGSTDVFSEKNHLGNFKTFSHYFAVYF